MQHKILNKCTQETDGKKEQARNLEREKEGGREKWMIGRNFRVGGRGVVVRKMAVRKERERKRG